MAEDVTIGGCRLVLGDCMDVLAGMEPCSVDAVVTDPPYHLTSGNAAFDWSAMGPGDKRPNIGATNRGGRGHKAGFMGKSWDGGDIAFRPETWVEVLRVLKPGGHMVCFGGTRTYHRLACAIEDAGFEIRDSLMWLYGSGFPKSLDVSKAIDKRGGADIAWFGPWLRQERERRGITQKDLARHFPSRTGNLTGCVANWELGLNLPTPEQFNALCEVLALPFARIEEAEREVIGRGHRVRHESLVQIAGLSDGAYDLTAPATDAARQWAGWHTALKPSVEPIVLARKPLAEPTVAAQVLATGTGALNVEATRVGTSGGGQNGRTVGARNREQWRQPPVAAATEDAGRWPPNLLHDGSPEVLAAFAAFGERKVNRPSRRTSRFGDGGVYEHGLNTRAIQDYADQGSAARFFPALGYEPGELRLFYSGKASGAERDYGLDGLPPQEREGKYGSIQDGRTASGTDYDRGPLRNHHPTVKPVALMQWLCKLVTPPGGVVLDCFAGSGSTLVAASRLGLRAIGIEREAEYFTLAAERLRNDAPLLTAPEPAAEPAEPAPTPEPAQWALFGEEDAA
jgi:DNA modification methylase/transcriptional regulator with XRE-family HTH domain